MIGILGGMGTQAGLDFCSKLAKINRGKIDQKHPLFLLYNKSSIPDRKQYLNKYQKVLKSLVEGCKFLKKNKCKFISIPCNTAHYWYEDLKKKVKIPILNMPELVFKNASRSCNLNIKIDDDVFPVEGTKIHEHGDPHSVEGFCNAVRVAYTEGKIKKRVFHADSFILIDVPSQN